MDVIAPVRRNVIPNKPQDYLTKITSATPVWDEKLKFAFKQNSALGFHEAYKKYYPEVANYFGSVLRKAYKNNINDEDIHDLTQKTFMVLWDKKDEFDESVSIKSRIHSITRNELLSFYEAKKRQDKRYDSYFDAHEDEDAASKWFNALSTEKGDNFFAPEEGYHGNPLHYLLHIERQSEIRNTVGKALKDMREDFKGNSNRARKTARQEARTAIALRDELHDHTPEPKSEETKSGKHKMLAFNGQKRMAEELGISDTAVEQRLPKLKTKLEENLRPYKEAYDINLI